MQPAHYAVSEAVLALVAAIAIVRLAPRQPIAALALAPFGLAALIGTIRLGFGMEGPILAVHQFVSRSGALFGLGCMAALLGGLPGRWAIATGLAAAAIGTAIAPIGQALFVLLVLGGAVLFARRQGMPAGLAFAVILIAQLVSAALRPGQDALAWHLFHLLVALWLGLVALNFQRLAQPKA